MKEKLLRKKLERQAEEAKKDVKLEDFSDEEYDTHKRFQEKQIKHTTTMQRPMGRRSRTPEAKNNRRGVTPSPPRRKKKYESVKKEERYSSEREAFTPPPEKYRRYFKTFSFIILMPISRSRSDSRGRSKRKNRSPSPDRRRKVLYLIKFEVS